MPISKNAYLTTAEMTENVDYLYPLFYNAGWTLHAISAMFGNMQKESTINPGIWQGLKKNLNLGFGLTQWTPATKLINWASAQGLEYTDIDVQVQRILYEVPLSSSISQWIPTKTYPLSFTEFTQSEDDLDYLTYTFMYDYERPKNKNQPERKTYAKYWYEYLSGSEPPKPSPSPSPTHYSSMPFLLYLRKR